jgi:hypothetical protein
VGGWELGAPRERDGWNRETATLELAIGLGSGTCHEARALGPTSSTLALACHGSRRDRVQGEKRKRKGEGRREKGRRLGLGTWMQARI